MTECPSSATLGALTGNSLPASIEAHLRTCATCREAWQRRRDEALFGELRAAFAATRPAEREPSSPVVVDGYDLLHELHRGGQGVVYKAMQKATRRVVALKVLLRGTHATPQQRQRFEREVDLAAQLTHSSIVTIFDSGDANGQPFYPMEYIEGQRLDEHARTLPLRARLELFRAICAAVGYAHRRGVIHRDLKPGNILIDADGGPHVLDFGLAKRADASDGTLTRSGEFLGTLAYAAPEQTRADPSLIDTRTDVYSLGVILYELLTGELPYRVHGSLAEAVANITGAEPVQPSERNAKIEKDVETIVLKALAKEPGRRYDSAEDLGRDVERYLNNDAIDARRDSAWYVLRKAAWRHRTAAATTAAILAALVTGLVVAVVFWQRAAVDRDRARKAEGEERDARARAEFQVYVANVAAALGALENHDVVDARQRLDQAPEAWRNWEWTYLSGRLDHSERTLAGHREYLETVAFTPDGAKVVSVSWDKTLRVWDVKTGELLRTWTAPAELWSMAVHPDGTTIVASCRDAGTIHFWNSTTGVVERTLKGPAETTSCLALSPDGSTLAAAFSRTRYSSSIVQLWRVPGGEPVTRFDISGHVNGLAFHPDGRLFSSGNGGLLTWNAATGKRQDDGSGESLPGGAIAIDRAGKHLVMAGPDQDVTVIDSATRRVRWTLRGHRQMVMAVSISPDGTTLASASRDKTIRLWNLASGAETAVLCGHAWAVSAVAFNPTGSMLVSGSWDSTVKLWRPRGAQPRTLSRHSDRVFTVAAHPNQWLVASGGRDGAVCLWDQRGRLRWQGAHQRPVNGVAFHPAGEQLASASQDGLVRLWSVEDGRPLRTLKGHTDFVHAVAYHPDGKRLISGSRDNTLRVWDVETGAELAVIPGHTDHVHSVACSPDGQRLASAGHQSIIVWDAQTHERITTIKRSMLQEDFSLAWHPNGRWIAAGAGVQTVAVWDALSGDEIARLRGHSDEIRAVAFSPDGTRLVTVAFDRSVRLWDCATWTEVARLPDLGTRVESLTFSHDGRQLIVGLANGGVALLE